MPVIAETARANARALGDVPRQLAALDAKTVGELQALHVELVGEPTRSRNREGLIKKMSWYIQKRSWGGLSPIAIERIAQLGDRLPERWLMRQRAQTLTASASPPTTSSPPRDPRLPPIGTVLRRRHGGVEHAVTVCDDGFSYAGERFRTLSAVAKRIAGTPWNGFAFFGLGSRPAASPRKHG